MDLDTQLLMNQHIYIAISQSYLIDAGGDRCSELKTRAPVMRQNNSWIIINTFFDETDALEKPRGAAHKLDF